MNLRAQIFLGVVTILVASCNTPRYMYSPTAHNVPVLVKQGDSKIAAYYSNDLSTLNEGSGKDKSHGYDLQGAVALTNNIALQASYINRTERNGGSANYSDSSLIDYKRTLTEAGLGYFTPMGERGKVIFQVFAGLGKGKSTFIDKSPDINSGSGYFLRHHEADVSRVYIQPAFMFRIKETFALSVSSRMSFINFRNIKTDYTPDELNNYQLSDLPYGSRTFWEPAFTNTIGFGKFPGLKLEYQLSTTLQISQRHIDYRTFNFAVGLLLDVSKLFKTVPPADEN
jgi:hypothetical protein